MSFEKKYVWDSKRKNKNVFSISLNNEELEEFFDLGVMLRQTKMSTIIKQAVKISMAKLRTDEKMIEILLGNERKNRRSGIEEVEIVKKELMQNLKIIDKNNDDFE